MEDHPKPQPKSILRMIIIMIKKKKRSNFEERKKNSKIRRRNKKRFESERERGSHEIFESRMLLNMVFTSAQGLYL